MTTINLAAKRRQTNVYELYFTRTLIATVVASTDVFTSPLRHGYANDAPITFAATGVNPLPGGVTAGVTYYVRDATDYTYKIASTIGGGAVPITSDGDVNATARGDLTNWTAQFTATDRRGREAIDVAVSIVNPTIGHGRLTLSDTALAIDAVDANEVNYVILATGFGRIEQSFDGVLTIT